MSAGQDATELTICCSALSQRAGNFVPPPGTDAEIVLAVQGPMEAVGALPGGVRVVPVKGVGVAKSRNAAIDSARTRFLLFTDDDVRVDTAGVLAAIQRLKGTGAAIALGVGVDPSGHARKARPKNVERLTLFNSGRAATYEMLIDVDQVRAAQVRFDERFGAGATNYLGDEYIFIADLLRSGRRGLLVPEVFGSHPVESSGSRWGTLEDAHARALVLNRVFGFWAFPVRVAFAVRRRAMFGGLRGALRFAFDFSQA